MTTGIAILNANGVGLAADSLVAVHNAEGEQVAPCIYGMEKIHPLISGRPVAFILAGNPILMDVDWRVISNRYFNECEYSARLDLPDLIDDFMEFAGSRRWFPPEEQLTWFERRWGQCASAIAKTVAEELEGDAEALRQKLHRELDRCRLERFVAGASELDVNAAMSRCGERMKVVLGTMLPRAIPEDCFESILKIATVGVYKSKVIRERHDASLLFAGYGAGDAYPSACVHEVGGVVLGKLLRGPCKRDVRISGDVKVGYLSIGRDNATVMFMNGIEQATQDRIEDVFSREVRDLLQACGQSQAPDFELQITEARSRFFVAMEEECYRTSRIFGGWLGTATVSGLARLACRLAQLEALDARYAYAENTVAEPIDVATLTTSGLEWRERKGPMN
jgi:hypothetical protein